MTHESQIFDLRQPGPPASQLPRRCSVLLGRSLGNKSSKDMAFPHPKSRKEHYRNDDKPNTRGVLWNFFNTALFTLAWL